MVNPLVGGDDPPGGHHGQDRLPVVGGDLPSNSLAAVSFLCNRKSIAECLQSYRVAPTLFLPGE